MKTWIVTDKDNHPSLAEAQGFLGGYVERVEAENGDILLVDEEGLLKGLPINLDIYESHGVGLVGSVIVIKESARPYNENGWG